MSTPEAARPLSAESPDPLVQAWRDWCDAGGYRSETAIRDAFAAGWDAALAQPPSRGGRIVSEPECTCGWATVAKCRVHDARTPAPDALREALDKVRDHVEAGNGWSGTPDVFRAALAAGVQPVPDCALRVRTPDGGWTKGCAAGVQPVHSEPDDEPAPTLDLTTDAGRYAAWHDDALCGRDAHGCACPCHSGYTPVPTDTPDR